MFDITSFEGVIPALVTPFDENEQVDTVRLRSIVNELIDDGANALYLTGSTGECFTMTAEERIKVIETVVEETNCRIPLIAHIGDIGTKKSVELAKSAASAGVDAISSVPPFYWKFNESEIFEYYKAVASSTQLPCIVYNIALAGLMGRRFIEKLAGIENVAGLKYTATTHFEIPILKNDLGPDFKIFSGCDEMGLSGLTFGADGLIGSFYNLMPEMYLSIYNLFKHGDIAGATKLQKEADMIIMLSLNYQYLSVIKMAMGWKGTGGGFCRSPFHNEYDKEYEIKDQFRRLRDEHEISGVKFLDSI